MSEISIKENLSKLEELFKLFNNRFYESKLKKPIIVLNPNSGNRVYAYGWCTVNKIWTNMQNEGNEFYEISICPEFMDRSFYDICSTLLHEMVHLWNLQNLIQDCSRGNTYHNKKFKEVAENHGLIIDYDKRIGWSLTKLQPSTKEFIDRHKELQLIPLVRKSNLKRISSNSKENEMDDNLKPKKRNVTLELTDKFPSLLKMGG